MSNTLITGITGFTGSHLAELLIKDDNNRIYGTIRGRCKQTMFIDRIKDSLTLLECDLTDFNSIEETIKDAEPDVIYHLAAQTFVPTSWRAPQETMNSNVIGTLNLLEAVRKSAFDPKILIAGSSEEYGKVGIKEVPIKETNPLKPLSPYGVSKVAQDLLGYQYHHSYGLKVIRTRAFNLMGPRSGEKIVTANLAKQVALMEKGLIPPTLKMGTPYAIRDFNDIRDIVRAYKLAIEKCDIGEVYNICTGKGYAIANIVEVLMELSQIKFNVIEDKTRSRPSDVPILIGDSTKFREATGWNPEIDFDTSMKDILQYWREQC